MWRKPTVLCEFVQPRLVGSFAFQGVVEARRRCCWRVGGSSLGADGMEGLGCASFSSGRGAEGLTTMVFGLRIGQRVARRGRLGWAVFCSMLFVSGCDSVISPPSATCEVFEARCLDCEALGDGMACEVGGALGVCTPMRPIQGPQVLVTGLRCREVGLP